MKFLTPVNAQDSVKRSLIIVLLLANQMDYIIDYIVSQKC